MDDLETASLKAQLEMLEHRWRDAMEAARLKGIGRVSDESRYQNGYADALDRCIQSLRELEDQW